MGRKRTKPIKPPAYQFKVGEEVIYIGGLYSEYKNKKCKIIGRSKTKGREWYRVKMDDEFEFTTPASTLRKEEEIENKNYVR